MDIAAERIFWPVARSEEWPCPSWTSTRRATKLQDKKASARRVSPIMARRLRCSSVTGPWRTYSFVAPRRRAILGKTALSIIFQQTPRAKRSKSPRSKNIHPGKTGRKPELRTRQILHKNFSKPLISAINPAWQSCPMAFTRLFWMRIYRHSSSNIQSYVPFWPRLMVKKSPLVTQRI